MRLLDLFCGAGGDCSESEDFNMPHDLRGEELKVGDTVLVPCVIKAIHLTEEYCNVDLVTREFLHPSTTQQTALTLNSRQTIKPRATFRYLDVDETQEQVIEIDEDGKVSAPIQGPIRDSQ